ncbi:MAG TPA: HD domain-containing protein [Dehalococcoidia bacterium]
MRRITVVPEQRRLLERLAAFFEARSAAAYATGGFLRDSLLGLPARDLDVALAGDSLAHGRALADELGGHFVALDEARGHVRVVLSDGDVTIDLTQLSTSIEDDLRQRDYTIDALGAPLAELEADEIEVTDPTGGLADLDSGLVRATSEAALREDPLRPLRGARIAVQMGFEIEASTRAMIARHAARVPEAAPERQREELMRILAAPQAGPGVHLLNELGLLSPVVPELDVTRGVEQPKEHHYDVFGHSVATVAALDALLADEAPQGERDGRLWRELWGALEWWGDGRAFFQVPVAAGTPRRALVKLCGLLHDIGKPATKTFEESGRMRFFGHSDAGAEIAGGLMRRLRFSGREREIVERMIEAHLRPVQMAQDRAPTKRAVYRYFRATGEAGIDTLFLSLADHLGTVGPNVRWEGYRAHVAVVSHILRLHLLEERVTSPPKLVSGDDLMRELGLEPGALLGELLEAVREAQAAGEVSTPAEALALARERLAEMRL